MSTSIGEIERRLDGLKTSLRKLKSEVGVEVTARAAQRSPVRTGALRDGWGFTMNAESITVWNTQDYAAYLEDGTPTIAPVGMLRTTLLELDSIIEDAKQRVGL